MLGFWSEEGAPLQYLLFQELPGWKFGAEMKYYELKDSETLSKQMNKRCQSDSIEFQSYGSSIYIMPKHQIS